MKRPFFLFSILWLTGFYSVGFGQMRLSEVMFNPAGSEYSNEFIEIFNRSKTDSVHLEGWRIGDEKALDPIVDAGQGLTVPPQGFVLILDPGYFGKSTQYDSLIPAMALVVTIGDNSFGSGGLSNSVPEKVILVNSTGDTVDAYRYSIDNPNGISDEKIDLNHDENGGNWRNSLVFNGTPGFLNSVAVRPADLAIRRVEVDSAAPGLQKQLKLTCVLLNLGRQRASDFKLTLFLDKNLDGKFEEPDEKIKQISVNSEIAPGDSVFQELVTQAVPPGFWPLCLRLFWTPDQNTANDKFLFSVALPFEPNALDFTEIMYRPEAGQPEWVELKNTTPETLCLFHWQFSDENTDAPRAIFTHPRWLPPAGRVLLAQDSLKELPDSLRERTCLVKGWPTLNNSGDEGHIWDPAGRQISQFSYAAEEVPVGFSLEKVEALLPGETAGKWLVSKIRGGTPGRPNSVNPLEVNGRISLASQDSIFEAGFGRNPAVPLELKNRGLQQISAGTIQISENLPGGERQLLWQEVSPSLLPGDSARIFLKPEGISPGEHAVEADWLVPGDGDLTDNSVRFHIRCGFPERAVLLNEILYAPRPGWPEWVEFFNPGEENVDMTHWQLTDHRRSEKQTGFPNGTRILPHDYLVVTGDSAFFSFYPEVQREKICSIRDFPHLGNVSDSLFLLDLTGGIVDWLGYRSSWGGQNGHSLERIRPENAARDSTNWAGSVADLGATPAAENSIYLHAGTGAAFLTVSPDPFSPDGDGRDDFVTFSIHTAWVTATANLTVFDSQGRRVREILRNRPIGSTYEILWDGRNRQGRALPVGLYIAFLEIFNEKMERKSVKKVFVLARRN